MANRRFMGTPSVFQDRYVNGAKSLGMAICHPCEHRLFSIHIPCQLLCGNLNSRHIVVKTCLELKRFPMTIIRSNFLGEKGITKDKNGPFCDCFYT